MYTVITNGFSSVYCACTIPKSRGTRRFAVLPHFGAIVCVCVYTVITNGFSSVYCACTILKSRGQRYPCHFLCQRSWVTCGKDIDQGRLIYVPAIVSTVDFLFLFMSCALFLRSRIWVRWNSTARQLRKSGEDYDIVHTFYLPLPHSVCVCVFACAQVQENVQHRRMTYVQLQDNVRQRSMTCVRVCVCVCKCKRADSMVAWCVCVTSE